MKRGNYIMSKMYDNITGRSPIATDDLGYMGTGNKASDILSGGGTTDYNDLNNKPTINNIELTGNLTSSDLGLQSELNEAQTNAVNSGITDALTEQITTNKNNILSIPRTTLNRLPYTITANATGNLVEYSIYGNSGGVGIATDNLLNPALFANDTTIGADGIPTTYPEGGRIATTTPVDVSAVNSVTLQYISSVTSTMWIYSLFSGTTLVRRVANNQNNATIDVSDGDSLYICFYGSGTITTNSVSNMMLATSSIPYQPYGKYKIPITVGDTTTNLIVDSPLTTGEIMTSNDFNTNIAIATGSNTISTSLTNKPIMYCKYV